MKPKRTLRLHNTAHNFLTLSLQRLPSTVNIPMHGARIFATPVARVCDLIKQSDLLLGPSVVVVVFTTWRRVVVIMNPLHDAVGDTPSSIRHSTRKKLSTMNDEIIRIHVYSIFVDIKFLRKIENSWKFIFTNLNHFLQLCIFLNFNIAQFAFNIWYKYSLK